MFKMTENAKVIGRTKMSLLLQGDNQNAVISAIIVRRVTQRRRLRFSGKVEFSRSVKNHIKKIILPIIDSILKRLGLPKKNFEISAVNLGAASALDIGVTISGLSADVPLFIAMLSQALQIPVSDDFVSTGHIASVEGDISAVRGIPAKEKAAQNDTSVKHFLCPNLEKDESLKALSPNQRNRDIDAIVWAKGSLRTSMVSGIGQLIRLVFTEDSIVLASLIEGFFDISKVPKQFNNPIQEVVSFLTCNNQRRFWDVLHRGFQAGDCEKGKELLQAYTKFYISRKEYPSGFGAKLFQLICSLPPIVRKLNIDFPIMDKDVFVELNMFTRQNDKDYVPLLFDAVYGRNIIDSNPIETSPEMRTPDFGCLAFDTVVSQINEQALARKFGIIDSARACFVLESSRIKSYEELINTLQAYYIHLQRYIGSTPEIPDRSEARSETIKLLEKTFYDKGGDKAAFVQARDCTQGGIRSILDMLTEQYKAEKQNAYINRVFKDAIADMDLEDRVKCIRAIMKKIGPSLPKELKDQPPERFARSDETVRTIIMTYVRCRDKFNQSLSSM